MLDVLQTKEVFIKSLSDKKYTGIISKVKDKKFSYQFLPNIISHLRDIKVIPFNAKKLKTTYLIDIVHSLVLRYYFRKENKFNLSSEILKEKYNSNYNYYMDYLVSIDVLELIQNHQKGVNARIYKLNERIFIENIGRYENNDRFLLKKYIKTVSSIETCTMKSRGIDIDIMRKLVTDLYSTQINYVASLDYLNKTSVSNSNSIEWNKYGVESIHKGHIFSHFDYYGRMHSNFTILKSTIRKNWVLIDNEETAEIDIHNSQPLFLCKLIMESDAVYTCDIDQNELNLFKQLTLNGCFYQHILDNTNYKEKKRVKELVYKVLFGKNFKTSKNDSVFKGIFPTIHNFIKRYKSIHDDYRALAYKLQNLESDFIFNTVIREIMDKHPDIKMVTVHDSIIYQTKYKIQVESIFYRKMKQCFNF